MSIRCGSLLPMSHEQLYVPDLEIVHSDSQAGYNFPSAIKGVYR